MDCPKCGTKNPDDANVCSSCSSALPKAPDEAEKIIPKMSSLAVAAFVLGILSLFSCGLTIIPALVLGIISFIIIEKSGGRLIGRKLAVFGVLIPIVLLYVVVMPMISQMRKIACAGNLSEIGMSMLVYANDYDGKFPRSGGAGIQRSRAPARSSAARCGRPARPRAAPGAARAPGRRRRERRAAGRAEP